MTRQAFVKVQASALPEISGILQDQGLSITGSMDASGEGMVALIIESDQLPEQCELGLRQVVPQIMVTVPETGGEHTFHISTIELVEEAA